MRRVVGLLFALLTMLLVLPTHAIGASVNSQAQYEYWFPYIDNTPAPSYSAFSSEISVSSIYNETVVFIDKNYNGQLDPGEDNIKLSAGKSNNFKKPSIIKGKALKIVSNKPVQISYHYNSADYSIYDDNGYTYSPPPLGTKFVVPFSVGDVYITATQNNTRVSVDNTTLNLNVGDVYSTPATSGTIITSDKPIAVVVVSNNKNSQDSSFATPLYPVSYFGMDFWIPPKIEVKYKNVKSDNRKIYITYGNGSVKTLEPTTKVMHYTTSKPAMLYYLFDVYAKDPWRDKIRHYMHAYPIPPSNVLGREYVVGFHLISTHDDNLVQIDSDYDGIFETNVTLDAGEEYNKPTRHSAPHQYLVLNPIGHVKAEYPILDRYVLIGNWEYCDEATWSYLCNGIDQNPRLTLPDTTIFLNETVSIPVYISTPINITGINFTMTYNSSIVNIVDVEETIPSNIYVNIDNITGIVKLAVVFNDPVYGNTTVLNIVVKGVSYGTTNLSVSGITMSDDDFNVIPAIAVGSTVTVVLKGDFNRNGEIDIGDAAYVAYMIIGKVKPDLKADFNENGKIDIGDLAKIVYYLLGKIDKL